MNEDIDVFDNGFGSDPQHPDNDVVTYSVLKGKFCLQVFNTDFSSIVNETENLEVFVTTVIEGSTARTVAIGNNTQEDNSVTMGIGFKKQSNTSC